MEFLIFLSVIAALAFIGSIFAAIRLWKESHPKRMGHRA